MMCAFNYNNNIPLCRCIFILLLLLVIQTVSSGQDTESLVVLKNKNIEVGILPEIGGRIVLLRVPGYKNILKADPELWKDVKYTRPMVTDSTKFVAYNGHIVWVGPQSDWWTNQDINKGRKEMAADWPPDPYLIFGHNQIISQTDSSISLRGVKSPITGLRIDKQISIDYTGKVTVNANAVNIRDEDVTWDLWFNTRLDGFAKCFVPIAEDEKIDFVKEPSDYLETTPYEVIDGYFTFTPSIPADGRRVQVQEAHMYPSANHLVGVFANQFLLIKFDLLNRTDVHKNHGLVEIYNTISHDGKETLLELEVHGKYKNLKPGEEMSMTENWWVKPYEGTEIVEEQVGFIKRVITSKE